MTEPEARGGLRSPLWVATALVSALGVVAEIVHHTGTGSDSQLIPLLSLSEEGNLPTWYSSVLLLCCSLQLAAIARHARRSRDRFTTAWRLLAIVFCYMSLDEVAQLHERLNSLVALRGVFYFGWIIPAGAIVLVVGVAYLRFIIRLPPVTRWRFIAAGVIYVGGALVMEMPLGMWATAHGEDNLGYVLIDGLEESLEMFGATLFLVALQCHRWALELSVTNAAQQRSAA